MTARQNRDSSGKYGEQWDWPLRTPEGWSTLGDGLAEYQHAFRFPLGPWYVSLYYRYALNRHGQKTRSPFSHNMDGTRPYREVRFWRFAIGACRLP